MTKKPTPSPTRSEVIQGGEAVILKYQVAQVREALTEQLGRLAAIELKLKEALERWREDGT